MSSSRGLCGLDNQVCAEKDIVGQYPAVDTFQPDSILPLRTSFHMSCMKTECELHREEEAPAVGAEVREDFVHGELGLIEIIFDFMIAHRVDMNLWTSFLLVPFDGRVVIEKKTAVQKELESTAHIQNVGG